MPEVTGQRAAVVYDRVAAVYDWYTAPMEAMGGRRPTERNVETAGLHIVALGSQGIWREIVAAPGPHR